MHQTKPPPIPLTKEALAAFTLEQERLTLEREQVIIRLQAAREMGDLSENGAYKAARWELGGIDRRLKKLHYLLTYATTFSPKRYDLECNGKQLSFLLVTHHESDPAKGKISHDSPLGQQLEGKKAGDIITLEQSGQPIHYKIMRVQQT
jgi:transcription elongation factor GreA